MIEPLQNVFIADDANLDTLTILTKKLNEVITEVNVLRKDIEYCKARLSSDMTAIHAVGKAVVNGQSCHHVPDTASSGELHCEVCDQWYKPALEQEPYNIELVNKMIASYQSELKDKVKAMKKSMALPGSHNDYYNLALDDVLKLLEEEDD